MLEQVAQSCNKHGMESTILLCDLTDSHQITQLCKKIFEKHSGGVSVLVNNAGILGPTDRDKVSALHCMILKPSSIHKAVLVFARGISAN